MAARKTKAVATPAPSPHPGPAITRAETYHEIPNGDGVMRVEPGDYVVTEFGDTKVYPPERFAETYPELVD